MKEKLAVSSNSTKKCTGFTISKLNVCGEPVRFVATDFIIEYNVLV